MPLGTVYLVGAGPGDPELITEKGRRILSQAQLVLYDALVHRDLLHLAPQAELEFVGKRAGRRSQRQSAINERLIEGARAGLTVVRLKGGDPFLFGRGSEEAEHLAAHGIPFEVVPGVPSPLAATAYAGLSLTHRDLSSSVAYLTATESVEKDRSSHDWAKLATATQTLVIFMGMRKLDTLMSLLMANGRPADTPAAVVQWASLPTQRTVVGTVATIADKAQAAEMGLPSLIIVGEVIRLREQLRWFDQRPLFGRNVLVTRAVHQAGSLAQLLRDVGARPRIAPTIALVPPGDREPLLRCARTVSKFDWVLFTSRNAVTTFWDAVREVGLDARAFPAVCAIGSKTAQALRERGIEPDLIPSNGHAEGVLEDLRPRLDAGSQILLPRAKVAREVIPDTLRTEGHHVEVVTAYINEPADSGPVLDALENVDAITFTSSSTVTNLLAIADKEQVTSKVLASIGPATTATLEAELRAPDVEAPHPTMKALVDALAKHYTKGQ